MTDPRRGKNMFVLGMLCSIYSLDLQLAREQIARIFGKKDEKVIDTQRARCSRPASPGARRNLDFKYAIPARTLEASRRSSSTATPRSRSACSPRAWTSARCTRSRRRRRRRTTCPTCFETVGGMVHQAEDEIAACAFAIGASYAGRCAVTITSGPGYSLKQEGIGLAVMAEIPLVVVNVQRGGPSTGQPTKVEQGDLLTAIYGSHGDAPKVVIAVSEHRGLLLFDDHRAQDRRDVQHGRRRAVRREPRDRAAAVPAAALLRGLARAADRPVAGARGRQALRLGPGHRHRAPVHARASPTACTRSPASRTTAPARSPTTRRSTRKACARAASSSRRCRRRSRRRRCYGDPEGDLLVVGWGSTQGRDRGGRDRARATRGCKVSSLHLRFIQPMPSGIREILQALQAR